ncbi:hypothetical protein AgCh_032509 [Apium graveolens]
MVESWKCLPKKNYSKNSTKNPLDLVYATPKPDKEKLLEAKKEEKVRLKQQKRQATLDAKNQAKKPTTTKTEMPTVIAEFVNEEKQNEPKQKKVPRQKFRANRKLDFDEEKE